MTVRGVLLDIDGTLIDSNDAHAASWRDVFAEVGLSIPVDSIRPLIGMGGDHILPHFTQLSSESAQGKKIAHRRAEIFKTRYLPGLSAFPQAHELLERMRAQGLKLVVATSARSDELLPLLQLARIDWLVEERTTSSDADESKPAPDIIQAALKKGALHPRDAIMLGDTPYDLEAARRAGVASVALRCGGWDDTALSQAVAIYDDPADLLRHFDDSPFCQFSEALRTGT